MMQADPARRLLPSNRRRRQRPRDATIILRNGRLVVVPPPWPSGAYQWFYVLTHWGHGGPLRRCLKWCALVTTPVVVYLLVFSVWVSIRGL